MAKKYAKGVMPPCPGVPEHYDIVDRKGFYYWRRKKGTFKPVQLNEALRQRSAALKALSPSIRHLRHTLVHCMQPLPSGSLQGNLFKWMQQSWIDNGTINYAGLRQQELHETYTLQRILGAGYHWKREDNILQLSLSNPAPYAYQFAGPLVTQFALEAYFITGIGDGIQYARQQSSLYDVTKGIDNDCVFEFELSTSDEPWMLLLKLISFEGKQHAMHPKYYGMRVLEVGG